MPGSPHPIDTVLVDGTPVAKTSSRSYSRVNARVTVASASVIRNTDFSGQFGGLDMLGVLLNLDPLDTVTADDGVTCIIDAAGNRFKTPPVDEDSLDVRIRFTAAVNNFYVESTGSDTTGDGSLAKPWLTLQKSYDVLIGNYDFAGKTAIVHIGSGSFKGLLAFGKCIGQTSFGNLLYQGAGSANTTIHQGGVPPTGFYCFAGAFGAEFQFSNLKLDGTQGAQDLVQAASKAVVGVGADVVIGDNVNPWTDLISYDGGILYVIDNYTVSKTFVLPTGNTTNGSVTISGVSDFTGIKQWQGVFSPGNIALDTWVTGFNVGAGTVTISKPAIATATGASIAFINGGVCHCTAGRNGIIDYTTNGEPTVGRTVTFSNLAAYFQGYQFCNGGRIDMQAVKFVNPGNVFAVPVTARAVGVCDNFGEGVGGDYPPGLFVYFDGATFTAGDESFTISVAAGVAAGQFINGYVTKTATTTNGSNVFTIPTITHVEGGCHVSGDGIPPGSAIVGISGSGPYSITIPFPCTATGTPTVKITGAGVRNGTYIKKIVGTTAHISQPTISSQTGIVLACGGRQESGGVLV